MSQVLKRSSEILSLLGSDPERRMTVSEIASACAMPASSCTRILKSLLDLGWVDQRGRRQSYCLGPRAYAMTTAQAYRTQLVERSYPVAQALADQTGQLISVSTRRGCIRQALFECAPGTGQVAGSQLVEHPDFYRSAGGRLLMAMCKKSVQEAIINDIGLPKPNHWPGIATRHELFDELKLFKRDRFLIVNFPHAHTSIVAVFPDGEGSYAVIGCHIKTTLFHKHPELIAQIKNSAKQLS